MDTPTIQTRRLILRPLALSDASAIQRHFNNWNVIKNLASVVPWPYPDDGAETFIRQQLEKIAAGEEIYQWVLVPQSGDGQAIGNIRFRPPGGLSKGQSRILDRGVLLEQRVNDRSHRIGERFCLPNARYRKFLRLQRGFQCGFTPSQAKDRRRVRWLHRASASQWPIEIGKMESNPRKLARPKFSRLSLIPFQR